MAKVSTAQNRRETCRVIAKLYPRGYIFSASHNKFAECVLGLDINIFPSNSNGNTNDHEVFLVRDIIRPYPRAVNVQTYVRILI